MMERRWARWSVRVVLVLVALLALLAGVAWWRLHASLPPLDGQLAAPGLAAPVEVRRDALGVPAISGATRDDVAYATGFVHAQDRFFQMDLLRRRAAGELAGLIGEPTADIDSRIRLHRFRARAQTALAALPPADRTLLQRYADGVNAGLKGLGAAPFEYALLRSDPVPWQPADTLLVVWTMYLDLQGYMPVRELTRGWLKELIAPEALAFLLPETSAYDAAFDGPSPAAPAAAIPAQGPDWIAKPLPTKAAVLEDAPVRGSNGWAIAGPHTRGGGAIVANDMHLGLMLPNIWYRAQLRFPGEDGRPRSITGVTLPGAPLVIIGSNGELAWGFTNACADVLDLVRIEREPGAGKRFKVAGEVREATEYRETIAVRGGDPKTISVLQIGEAPIREAGGAFYLEHWAAHQPGAVNVGLRGLENARSVEDAVAVANRAGIPALNFVVGDRAGRIGWTIAGALAARDADLAKTFPLAADADAAAWAALRAPEAHPRVVAPANGRLWNANNRPLAIASDHLVGDGGADMGARARQIGEDLMALPAQADEKSVYGVQLDDRAPFMAPWRDRALRALDAQALAGRPERQQFRDLLAQRWTGRASPDSQGYRLARAFLDAGYDEVFGAADVELKKKHPRASFAVANMRWPLVLGQLLDAKPQGWLPAGRSWHDVELAIADRAIRQLKEEHGSLEAATWGARNPATIAHPIGGLLPGIGRWLAAPPDPLPGDIYVPRVSERGFGASQRMVVMPGREQDGILNMPGGQSGHPLSPYFLAGHDDWVQGRATPFLPGEARHTLVLAPR
ncbi:MAG: penicillin acylase family protein [Pseudomonadota bacterium]